MFPLLRQISPRLAHGSQAALNFLAARSGLLLCAIFLLAGLALAGDYPFMYDERIQRQIARANWDYIAGRADYDGFLVRTDSSAPQLIPSDRYYGVGFELPLLLAERALDLSDYYYIRRLRLTLSHLFFIVGAFCCYRLAYHLFGSRLIALLALLLYLLHPRIYAHSFFNSKDLPFLSMFMIALYLLERAFRRDTIGAFVLLGIGVGLLTNLRIMGIMLLAATLGMRGLDWFYAGEGPERKHILLTVGLFVLAAGLTLYALSPYAWRNPADYLATSLNLTLDRPVAWPQLFQGEWILSTVLPPHYAAAWAGLTTPPLIMLLGFIGIAATLAGAARPGAVFRNTRQRFRWLLLACFLLPPLAAILLNSDLYHDWRHLYFVYAPFALLAALGGGWLAAALWRQRRWRGGGYGLAGLGLGLVLLQMVQLHPLQYIYFNFLADRTTPEYLRTQYYLDHWEFAQRAALEYILNRHPGESLVVRAHRRHIKSMSPESRQRLQFAGGGRRADYGLSNPIDAIQPDLAFNSVYGRFYNNTLVAVRPLDISRMEPAAVAAYRELYRQAVAGDPIIRADYNVYRNGKRLAFVKENCPPTGRDVWFGAKVVAAPPDARPLHFRGSRPYTTYGNSRVSLGKVCLAVVQLPDYAQGDLILTQHNLGNHGPTGAPLWEELYSLSRPGLAELIADRQRKEPAAAAAAAFTVFIDRDNGRHRLIYAKPHCSPAEYETPATLHLYPENLADLPFYLWKGGLDNRDFRLSHYGGRPGGECVAVFPLPDYPIQSIRTGQANRWEVNLYPTTEPAYLRATYAALAAIQPDARAVFDLYWRDNRLIYLRETCAAADTAAGFFLHIIPAEVADLPQERQAAGFANRDFAFDRRGGHFDGKCLAAVPLPNYPIKTLRTGQYVAGQGELWAAELAVGR